MKEELTTRVEITRKATATRVAVVASTSVVALDHWPRYSVAFVVLPEQY